MIIGGYRLLTDSISDYAIYMLNPFLEVPPSAMTGYPLR
jgi:hypothetical protein